MKNVIETVQFKLIAGAHTADFLKSNTEINDWLRLQPGFEWRRLCQLDTQAWLDVVQWKTMEAAQQAAEKVMVEKGNSAFMSMIDMASATMQHATVHDAI
jgi:hypothetical protein